MRQKSDKGRDEREKSAVRNVFSLHIVYPLGNGEVHFIARFRPRLDAHGKPWGLTPPRGWGGGFRLRALFRLRYKKAYAYGKMSLLVFTGSLKHLQPRVHLRRWGGISWGRGRPGGGGRCKIGSFAPVSSQTRRAGGSPGWKWRSSLEEISMAVALWFPWKVLKGSTCWTKVITRPFPITTASKIIGRIAPCVASPYVWTVHSKLRQRDSSLSVRTATCCICRRWKPKLVQLANMTFLPSVAREQHWTWKTWKWMEWPCQLLGNCARHLDWTLWFITRQKQAWALVLPFEVSKRWTNFARLFWKVYRKRGMLLWWTISWALWDMRRLRVISAL